MYLQQQLFGKEEEKMDEKGREKERGKNGHIFCLDGNCNFSLSFP